MDLKSLSDAQLIANLHALAAKERRNLRSFLEHLKEFDQRRLAGKTPHATTFMYCTQELRLSEGEAYRRMQVAGVIERFPRLLRCAFVSLDGERCGETAWLEYFG